MFVYARKTMFCKGAATPVLNKVGGIMIKALASLAPSGPAHQALDGFLDPFGHPQLEQIRDAFLFRPCHVGLRAPVAVTAN